ncbi:MAG: haloalkane dehalogenase [Deltaproteobacteria bacterium]|nr:haloalkane dehalogenase [Deltaproteobacteria bacterium]
MKCLRTPDDRFTDLPGYPFAPHYQEVPTGDLDGDGGTLRMHFVDEGPRDAPVVLMLHGEPSWSYLYRKVIARVVAAGLRAVAPDLPGFGRSDKPATQDDYTYQRHVDWMWAFLEAQSLRDITLLCQDWGGLIGLRLVGEHPERFARVVAANTFLPTAERPPQEAFLTWRRFSQEVPELPVGFILQSASKRPLTDAIRAAYEAPFPDESYKAGARKFPLLVPIAADDPAVPANLAAWQGLERFQRPFLTAFGDSDPITRGADRVLQARIPGAKDQPHTTLKDAGHFLQEDAGEELGDVVVDFVRRQALK